MGGKEGHREESKVQRVNTRDLLKQHQGQGTQDFF